MNVLKAKSENATPEPFVFIAIDATNSAKEEQFAEMREAGNEHFKNRHFNDAIKMYTDAIDCLVKLNRKECARELAIFYQNRSAANEFMLKSAACISDATKSIETDENYAKAYYRRAKGFVQQGKLYCAMQDIVQACVLKQFRNDTFNNMAAAINGRFALLPVNSHAARAYEELDCVNRDCAHCIEESLRTMKRSTLIDPLITAIDENAPNTGYNRVIRGLNKYDYDEIKTGYKEEMDAHQLSKPTLNYFRTLIIGVYAVSLGSRKDKQIVADGLKQLIDLLDNQLIPDAVKTSAQLCIACILDSISGTEAAEHLLRPLQEQEPENAGIYLIRSGFFRLSFLNPSTEQYEAMVHCCKLMPRFFSIHFHRVQAKFHAQKGQGDRAAIYKMLADLEKLGKQFPNEIDVPMLLGRFYGELGNKQLAKYWTNAAASISCPDDMHMLYINRGLLKPMHPSSVDCFKKAIQLNPMATKAYRTLFTYYMIRTREYGKALEVINRALMLCNERSDLMQMFAERKELLDKIVKQNFWSNL